jgi:biotin carboxyl carrier protein
LGWEVKVDLELILDGKTYQVATNKTKDGYKFKVDDTEVDFSQIDFSGNCFKLNVNGQAKTVYVATDKGKSYVHIDGTVIPIEAAVEESESGAAGNEEIVNGKQIVHAPMPGKVVKIAVTDGQQVKEKEILCVIEAMKMENEIRAKIAGVVKQISFKAGDLVGTEETILIVEPEE